MILWRRVSAQLWGLVALLSLAALLLFACQPGSANALSHLDSLPYPYPLPNLYARLT